MLNYHDENFDICTMRIITIFRLNFNISLFHSPLLHLPENHQYSKALILITTHLFSLKNIFTKTIQIHYFFEYTINKVNSAKTPIIYNNNIFKSKWTITTSTKIPLNQPKPTIIWLAPKMPKNKKLQLREVNQNKKWLLPVSPKNNSHN